MTEAGVEVRAPLRSTLAQIEALLTQKQAWILRRRAQLAAVFSEIPLVTYDPGGLVPVMGRSLALRLDKAGRVAVRIEGEEMVVVGPKLGPDRVRAHLKAWYIVQAEAIFEDRVALYLPQIGRPYRDIQIKTLKRRWGSCTLKGELTFNWTLMMAPLWVLDYVVIHELCHLKVMNHSVSFWREVGKISPEYKKAVQWLKHYGPALKLP